MTKKNMDFASLNWTFPLCPVAPDYRIDWPALEHRFAWLRTMADCPQDPVHHAEGDVLTHTKLVCEALAANPGWRALPDHARSILFVAALMHDIAKPACTKIEEDGRIVSPNHNRRGAYETRMHLWTGDDFDGRPIPFYAREMIVGLIRRSSLPYFALENADGAKRIIHASMVVRCDWLAILSEADTRGRECADRQSLLDKIELFREFCLEQRCYDAKRAFASDHARFIYFQKENGDPDYAAFDDTRNTVTLMCGLPGAGKDTWIAANRPDLPVVSLDELRREMNISPEDNQGRVIAASKERARTFLRTATPFVWNATNTSRRIREGLIELFTSYGARTEIVYCEAPLDDIFRRNAKRAAVVPARVIRRLAESLDLPDASEAHGVNYAVGHGG